MELFPSEVFSSLFLPSLPGPTVNADNVKRGESVADSPLPSATTRSLLSLWIVVHFGILAVSLSTLFGMSPLQDRLIQLSSPYLSPTHLRLDSRPLIHSDGQPSDWRHEVQWREGSAVQWQTITVPANWLGNDVRLSRFAGSIAAAAAVENTPTASMLAMPLAQQVMASASGTSSDVEIRIIARVPATLQQEMVTTHGGVIDDSVSPPVIERWRAAIIVESELAAGSQPRLALVMVKEDRLNALPQPPSATMGQP